MRPPLGVCGAGPSTAQQANGAHCSHAACRGQCAAAMLHPTGALFQLTSQERPCHSKSEVSPAGRRRRFLPGSGPTSHLREALRHGQLWLSPPAGSNLQHLPLWTRRPMQQQQDSVLPSPSRSLETLQRHTDEALPRPLLPSPPPDPFPSEGLPITGCCLAVCGTPRIPTTAVFPSRESKPPPFLSVRLAQRVSPVLPATLRKPTCPRTEIERAIKAGVNEHRRSVPLPQLGDQARLAGTGPVLSLGVREGGRLSPSPHQHVLPSHAVGLGLDPGLIGSQEFHSAVPHSLHAPPATRR